MLHKFSSREKLALLLSGIVSTFLVLVFCALILINHYTWIAKVQTEIKHELSELLEEDLISEKDDSDETEDDSENYYIYDSYANGRGAGIFLNKTFLLSVLANQKVVSMRTYWEKPYTSEQMFFVYRQNLPGGGIIYAENITNYYDYERRLLYSACVLVVLSIILSWFVGFFVGKIILSPLKKLNEKVKMADLGKIPKNVSIEGKQGDEIIELSTILQGMFEKIELSYQRVSDFNHNVSHELKNPLAIIRSDIELAVIQNDTKRLSKTLHELKYLDEIINKLLFIAHDSDKIILCDVGISQIKKIIEEVSANIGRHYESKNVSFQFDIGNIKKIKIDKDLFKELVFNLIENAYKYSDNGGNISLSLESEKLLIVNRTKREIGPEIERVFEPFFKLDSARSEKGYGIGLSIVKKICDLFSWEISAESINKEISFEIRWKATK